MVIALRCGFGYFFIVQFADFLSSCKIDSSLTVSIFCIDRMIVSLLERIADAMYTGWAGLNLLVVLQRKD